MRTINGIVVHCSASPVSVGETAEMIDIYHRSLGWDSIGYHFVIELDGTVVVGRPEDTVGAHVFGHNEDTLGICYVGGRNENNTANVDTLNEEQALSLEILLFSLSMDWPLATIRGHRDYPNVAKDCPCFDVREWCLARGIYPN